MIETLDSGASTRRLELLQAMGIDVWVSRSSVRGEPAATTDTSPPSVAAPRVMPPPVRVESAAQLRASLPADLNTLRARVAACTACALHQSRTQTVFGVGDPNASCLVIGEAPGAEEDKRGEPFVGRAGQLLDAMLSATGLGREQVYIANILKCRPPGNRDPQPDEAAACREYLDQQVALIGPRVILAVGRIAAHNLLGVDIPIGRLRGKLHYYGDERIPVIVTYHPAYLLRSPREKAKSWLDLRQLAQLLATSA